MNTSFLIRRITTLLMLAAFVSMGASRVMAAPEPTLDQVYRAAQAGKLDQANQMMQQVLVAHPNSAKAHFVQAELSARQGDKSRAREELGIAEKLAPGLAFAKPEAVQSLRAQLSTTTIANGVGHPPAAIVRSEAPVSTESTFPWGMALALGAGALALGWVLMRRKPASGMASQGAYPSPAFPPGGLNGPQTFGIAGGGAAPGYGPPVGSGLGGRVMGGLATGLAVGAGVMAAQAIGKSLFGQEEHAGHLADNQGQAPAANNYDLGGQDFGVNDTSSWDDSSSVASGGDGGDWDS
jgi:hypothetical protein